MHSIATRYVVAAMVLSAGVLLGACGGGGTNGSPQSQAPEPPHGESHGMNMGDPAATPADEIEGAQLREGPFDLLDTRPPGLDNAAGTAWLATHDDGTTVTVRMTGLQAGEKYVSHLHAEPCEQDSGGPHFKFDPQGPEMPPNEVHLAFTADEGGKGSMTVNNDRPADEAESIVVHPAEAMDNRIVCADF